MLDIANRQIVPGTSTPHLLSIMRKYGVESKWRTMAYGAVDRFRYSIPVAILKRTRRKSQRMLEVAVVPLDLFLEAVKLYNNNRVVMGDGEP